MKKLLLILITLASINCFSQEIEFGKVSKAELEEKFYPLDSTADAAYLFRERKTFYEYRNQKGFVVVTEVHERIKIYTKNGFNKANRSISYYKPKSGSKEKISSLKGYSFNLVNGKIDRQKLSKSSIFDEEISKFRSRKRITFPNIKEGTIIDLKYNLISPYTTSIDELEFQFEIPVKKLEYEIAIPEYYVFNKKSKGYFSPQVQSSVKNDKITMSQRVRSSVGSGMGTKVRSTLNTSTVEFKKNIDAYSAKNIPAIKTNEPFIGSLRSYKGGLTYEIAQTNFVEVGGEFKSYSNNWEQVSKQIHKFPNFGSELDKTKYFINDITNIIKDTKNENEKVLAIFQFVKSKVKWNDYYGKYTDKGVKKAYKDGVGNVAEINLILTSMLREVGLNANPVLVSTRNNGIPLFPTLDGFNYVITIVEFPDGKHILLDATEPYSSPNILPIRVLNWKGRKVTKDGNSSWIKLISNKTALEENIISVKIAEDRSVNGLLRTKYLGLNALNFRQKYSHIKDEGLILKLEEKHNIEIEDFRLSNKTDANKPISQIAKFTSDDLIEEINGKLYINSLLFLTIKENPFKSKERNFPVDFASPWKDSNNVSMQIPEGYKVESIPDNLAIGLPDNLGVFKFQITSSGSKIKILSILEFNSSIITTEYYSILKEFYSKVVDKQLEKIVLSK